MSVNKVILVGNLGKDPELRYTPSGAAVVNFSLATSENYKDREGKRQEKTEWHNVVAWRQLAEICGKYLHKGKQVYIEGKLTTRKWQGRDGIERYTTEIVADTMHMLGRVGDSGGGGGQGQNYARNDNSRDDYSNQEPYAQNDNEPNDYRRNAQGAPSQQVQSPNVPQEPSFNPDDEIPF